MDLNTLDLQQARIKQILFKSQLRSVLYGVREADETLFSRQGNPLGQWLETEVGPRYAFRPELREAEQLLQQMLSTSRELVSLYRRGRIEESRRGLSQIDSIGERFVSAVQRLGHAPAPRLATV